LVVCDESSIYGSRSPLTGMDFTLTYPYGYTAANFPNPIVKKNGGAITNLNFSTASSPNYPNIEEQWFSLNITGESLIEVMLQHTDPTIPPINVFLRVFYQAIVPLPAPGAPISIANAVQGSNVNEFLWNETAPTNIAKNIHIPNGKTLRISKKVIIPENCGIVVEPGGHLILTFTAHLTSGCGKQWRGIEVLSKLNLHGECVMGDGAIIEHAQVGISSGVNPRDGKMLYLNRVIESGGGRIIVNGGRFINNTIAIAFHKSPSPVADIDDYTNTSPIYNAEIINSKFKVDANYRTPNVEPICIYMLKSKNVLIDQNTFHNHRYNTAGVPISTGYGIRSVFSNYKASKNFIFGFKYGINSTMGYTFDYLAHNERVFVDENEIAACTRGLYFAGFSTFGNNTIAQQQGLKVINNTIYSTNDYGFYSDVCTRFEIENNLFIGTPLGLIVWNSGEENNIVYRNSFLKPNTGIFTDHCVIAWGKNKGNSNKGLQLKCNQFSGQISHIWVNGNDENCNVIPDAGVRDEQGDEIDPTGNPLVETKKPAGNIFDDIPNNPVPATIPEILFTPLGGIKYFYHRWTSPNSLVSGRYIPTIPPLLSGTVGSNYQDIEFDYTVSCEDHYLAGTPLVATPPLATTMTALWQQRIAVQTQKHILSQTLNNLKDGGNTPLLKNQVETTQIQDAYALYANLMAKSPYLSEEVLAELGAKENFPKPLLRDIMVANKHAGKDTEVITKLENRTDELPEYMLLQIKNAAASGLSAKELLENSIAAQSTLLDGIIETQIKILRSDAATTLNDYTTVLDNTSTIAHRDALMQAYWQMGSSAAFTAAIADFQANAVGATDEVAGFIHLYQVLASVKAREGRLDSLTTLELTALGVFGHSTLADIRAIALTEVNEGIHTYVEPLPVLCSPLAAARQAKKEQKVSPAKQGEGVRVLPNPAKDYVSFETQVWIDAGSIEIYAADGKLMYKNSINDAYSLTIPTHEWQNGLYVFRIISDNAPIAQGKFNILK
jgi:hypothetical protein